MPSARPGETRPGDPLLAACDVTLECSFCLIVGLEWTAALIAADREVPVFALVPVDSIVHPIDGLWLFLAAPFHHALMHRLYA
jgi:hypothetical protein|tara:strand:- start:1352 stop:1600 length:249 start_codon:yes stop_codon:yes gene_type:complete